MKSSEEAERELDPYLELFYQCFAEAFETYNSSQIKPMVTPRSHANVIHDLACSILRRELDGDSKVKFIEDQNLTLLLINEYCFRFKKLDLYTHQPRNNPTARSNDFLQQCIDGMGEQTNVDLGYTLAGAAETKLRVYLRCPQGVGCAWEMEINEPEIRTIGTVPMEPQPIPLSDDTKKRRVKVRHEQLSIDKETIDESGK